MSPASSSFEICVNGHFFEATESEKCPFCGASVDGGPAENFSVPVGWLVITAGPMVGQDFTVREGANEIGRSAENTVSLPSDFSVSDRKHAILIYDAATNTFSLQPEAGTGSTKVNGMLALNSLVIRAGDKLEFGATPLVFIPLASQHFRW